MRLNDKIQAIELRRQGKSYSEIMEQIPNLSRSTLSCWLSYLTLTSAQRKLLEKRARTGRAKARLKASITNRERRIQRMNETINKAEAETANLIKKHLFLTGIVIYWCEGSQKTNTFSFINSDPIVIKIMVKWLNDICKISKESIRLRLYIHKVYAKEKCEEFWSKELNIPLSQIKITYKPTPHQIKRNSKYKGCLRIDCGGVELFRRFLGWKKGLIEYLNIK